MFRHRLWLRAALLIVLTAAVLAVAIYALNRYDAANHQEKRGEMSDGFGRLKTVTIDNVTWREKPAVTTMLIAGIDKPDAKETSSETNYRDGGQADFLMLLAIDHTDRKIHRLQLERDTMAEIDILGIFGNEVGTRVEQLCLAHRYGATPEDNAKYTVRAVERLLGGLQIDSYYMIDYTAMGQLNDAVDGVTVDIAYDMTSVNPAWTPGSRVTLHGDEAEAYVRARRTVGSGTNEERMVRQNTFMTGAIARIKEKLAENLHFADQLLRELEPSSVSNMTTKWLSNELYNSRNYEILSVEHPAGEYRLGADGYVEFHMQESAATDWVLDHLYTKVS